MKEETKQNNKLNNMGTSMVTVVISFALLLIFVTGYYQVQKVTEGIMNNARDIRVNNRQLIRDFYLGTTENEQVLENAKLVFEGKNGSFYINADLYKASEDGLQGTIYYYQAEE